jgi:hypothetical protein
MQHDIPRVSLTAMAAMLDDRHGCSCRADEDQSRRATAVRPLVGTSRALAFRATRIPDGEPQRAEPKRARLGVVENGERQRVGMP